MFDKFADFLDRKFSSRMAKIAEQKHLRAIRDGVIATLPIIIVSSIFLIVAFSYNQLPASWELTKWIKNNAVKILLPYRMGMYIMTLYAVFGIGNSLAKSYDLDGMTGGILSELAFLMTIVPCSVPDMTDALQKFINANKDMSALNNITGSYVISTTNLGSAGIFVGIIVSFFAVEVYRFTDKSGFQIKMPPQVPESVSNSFKALTPTAIIMFVIGGITMWCGVDLHSLIGKAIAPLVSGTDTLPAAFIVVFLEMFFWSFGIHGSSIVYSLARPLWLTLLNENINAVAAGHTPTHIICEPFFQWFVQIGGSGCTISLAILLALLGKSQYGKAIGRTCIVPGIFNINEPIIFGCPLILNPTLLVPFILSPIVNMFISYFAIDMGLVSKIVVMAPWTLPGPVGAFLATGGDWRAAVLSIVLICISGVIYYPFFKMFDKQLLKEESKSEQPTELV